MAKRTMTRAQLLATMERLGACDDAVRWVEATPGTAADLWRTCERGDWLVWLLSEVGYSERVLRHLAADFAEEVAHLADPDAACAVAWAIGVARRCADGEVGREEIDAARDAAVAAAWAAARAAARDAAGAAAWAAAWDAAGAAAWDAAGAAAWDAAGDAEREWQVERFSFYFTVPELMP
jgi:hypothetical protein